MSETKKLILTMWLIFMLAFFIPLSASAKEDIDSLKDQIKLMSEMIKSMQGKIEKLESENINDKEEIAYIDERLSGKEFLTKKNLIFFNAKRNGTNFQNRTC